MRRNNPILNAILLLIAGTLAIGGPIAVHHAAAHHPQTAAHHDHAHHADHPGHSHAEGLCLPAENPFPTDQGGECPDCDLLTTLTIADTAVATIVVSTTSGWTNAIQPCAPVRTQTDRAPRTTRGPPAA